MSSLFCGCCTRLFRRSDTRSPSILTLEAIGVPPGGVDHTGPVYYVIRDDTSTRHSGPPPMNVQPRDSGPISSSSVWPHPAQGIRVAAEIVSVSEESHIPSAVDELIELRKKCGRFRVLVLGRANAGKTTLLKAVCGAAGDPEVLYDSPWEERMAKQDKDSNQASQSLLSPTAGRGEHNINTQLVFPSNQGFIFHDSRGFEAGSDEEMKAVTEFIQKKGDSRELKDQLHVIWYCIPTDNEARLLSGPEQELLRKCSAGPVPLVVIFTKFDSLEAKAFHELKGTGLTRQQAQQDAPQHAYAEFQRCHLPHLFGEKHPKYICLKKMHKEQNNTDIQGKMAELIQQTVDAIGVDALKLLLVSVQRNNLQLTIEYAVRYGNIQGLAEEVFAAGNIITRKQVAGLIEELVSCFGYIVHKADNLETDDQIQQLRFPQPRAFPAMIIEDFHPEIYSHLDLLVGPLPRPLHVPALAIGILIVVAQLFWHAHGKRPTASQIHEVMELYLRSGRADAVRAQVEEELRTLTQYYIKGYADGVIKIVMENLLGDH